MEPSIANNALPEDPELMKALEHIKSVTLYLESLTTDTHDTFVAIEAAEIILEDLEARI